MIRLTSPTYPPAAPPAAPAAAQRSRSFAADAATIAEARQFLRGLLDGSPIADDAVLCLSEVATNSITHSLPIHPLRDARCLHAAVVRGVAAGSAVRGRGG
jgi:hypothetical protein